MGAVLTLWRSLHAVVCCKPERSYEMESAPAGVAFTNSPRCPTHPSGHTLKICTTPVAHGNTTTQKHTKEVFSEGWSLGRKGPATERRSKVLPARLSFDVTANEMDLSPTSGARCISEGFSVCTLGLERAWCELRYTSNHGRGGGVKPSGPGVITVPSIGSWAGLG